MKQVWICTALLLVANTACAASFDCEKAGTKVEKMICGDTGLSELDGELGKVYSKALSKASDPSALKQQQRDWLKERNECEDTNCLKEKYQAQITSLPRSQATFATIFPPDISEFDVNCEKPKNNVERLVCKEALTDHRKMRVELQWTLMRVKDKQGVIDSQRQWQKQVRDKCTDGYCLRVLAYQARTKELLAMQARPDECYVPRPVLDAKGYVEPIDPVCQAMEANLNKFCDQPPMVCKLKVAPEVRKQITFPKWTKLDPEANRALIKEFIQAPLFDAGARQLNPLETKIWQEEKTKINAAFAAHRITFSKSKLDLYNMGKAQTAYRLDYGTCHIDNPQLDSTAPWNRPLNPARVKIQLSPEVVRPLFKKYFPLDNPWAANVFLYGGQTFSYWMFGSADKGTGEIENWLDISRREQWINPVGHEVALHRNWLCRFSYQEKRGEK